MLGVVADSRYRTMIKSLLGSDLLIYRNWLLLNNRMAGDSIVPKDGRSYILTEVTVDTLAIDVIWAANIV